MRTESQHLSIADICCHCDKSFLSFAFHSLPLCPVLGTVCPALVSNCFVTPGHESWEGRAPLLSAGIPKMPQGEFAAVGHSGPRSTSARVSSVALPGCELCIQNCWSATSAPLSCLVCASLPGPIPFPWLAESLGRDISDTVRSSRGVQRHCTGGFPVQPFQEGHLPREQLPSASHPPPSTCWCLIIVPALLGVSLQL